MKDLSFFCQHSNNTMHNGAISREESQGHGHDKTSCSTQMFRARYQLWWKCITKTLTHEQLSLFIL